MTPSPTDAGSDSPVKRALREIRDLRAQLAQAQDRLHGPIAIVGMGLRFPGGVSDAASYANLLWSAVDAISPIPADRWPIDAFYSEDPDAPGRMTTRFGGFIDRVDHFDAEFFGISPREAASMDPQQRLMLEVAWAAIEDAGQAPGGLGGSRTGVYLGVCNNDYGRALFADRDSIDAYFSTGNAYSVVAGRLSYLLGLQGPSIAIDTACSSSLVALHLACQGLRRGECDMALAGAVNLILTPEMNINFSRARMMAPDGRCKTFDAAADGYVRGEGCAVLVLRRLADALADRDRILAVIRGSAINQDGRSGGLTAPNGPAQESVIRAALEDAGAAAGAVGYVEAHGTGTPLGDPVEIGALGAVYGEGRTDPLLVGSVKTNIGHLEAAAGLAAVAKVALALQRREIPPQLHFSAGNPHVDWTALPVKVVTCATPWSPLDGRRLAGVSAFGFSGTNAHVVLEEAPPLPAAEPAAERPRHLLALSARDPVALAELVRRFDARIAAEMATIADSSDMEATPAAATIADLCHTANAGRSHFRCRIAVTGGDLREIRRGLRAFTAGEQLPALMAGAFDGVAKPKVAFLFTGQGAQHAGMSRRLYETSPSYRQALSCCAARLDRLLDRPTLEVMFAPPGDASIDRTDYAQPLLFAHQYALAQLWRSWGIEPAAVLGHSLGEYAAACLAGVIPLDDALELVAARGRLGATLPPDGAMAAVSAPVAQVQAELARDTAGATGAVTIAAFNGPEHVVLSGRRDAVEAIARRLEAAGFRTRLLRVAFAAHSPHVDAIVPAFGEALASVAFGRPRVTLVSNLTGQVAEPDAVAAPAYWLAHLREPVMFSQSMQTLADLGITHCIEIGPHPVLLGMAAECLPGNPMQWLPSLHRERPDWTDLLESLQRLYVDGAEVDWQGFDVGYPRRRIALPTYPFGGRRHWMAQVGQAAASPATSADRWSRLTAALARQSDSGPLDLNAPSYAGKWDCLARLTSAHAVAVLRDAGLFLAAGERLGTDAVLAASGIRGIYRHLVQRWLERLVRQELLAVDGDAFVAPAPLPAPDLAGLWAEADRVLADNPPLLAYVRNCTRLLDGVLKGKESALETLFPNGSFELAAALYERSTTMRYINGLAAAALGSVAAAWPAARTLRIMEVGAGTGGTTSALLPALASALSPACLRYCYTDVSDVFLEQAAVRFASSPFIDYRRFDVDQDPSAQGFAPQAFDVIVSANAIHASRNLRLALQRLHALLAPGGVLLLVESTCHMDWFDMTTGLIEGWQHFEDDLRDDNPLLPPQTWLAALTEAGFSVAEAWPAAGSIGEVLGQHVLVARAAGARDDAGGLAPQVDEPAASMAARVAVGDPVQEPAAAIRERLAAALPGDRLEILRDFVRERVVRVLRLDPAEPPGRHLRLMDLGFDSLMAVQLRNQLGAGLGLARALPATLMFDYPTIDALAAHLLARITPQPATPADSPAGTPADAASGRSPGAARDEATVLGTAAVAAMSDEQVEALLLERLDSR